jgi:hypothetical protein
MNPIVALTYFMMNFGVIFAQASANPQDLGGWLALLNVGLAGVGLLAFVRGWIVPGIIHTQALEREKAKDTEIERLRKIIIDAVLPEMERGKDIQEKMIRVTEEFLRFLNKSDPTRNQ